MPSIMWSLLVSAAMPRPLNAAYVPLLTIACQESSRSLSRIKRTSTLSHSRPARLPAHTAASLLCTSSLPEEPASGVLERTGVLLCTALHWQDATTQSMRFSTDHPHLHHPPHHQHRLLPVYRPQVLIQTSKCYKHNYSLSPEPLMHFARSTSNHRRNGCTGHDCPALCLQVKPPNT
jgi:hypothetical protein